MAGDSALSIKPGSVTVPTGAAMDSCNVLPALLGLPHDKPGRDTLVTHVGKSAGVNCRQDRQEVRSKTKQKLDDMNR